MADPHHDWRVGEPEPIIRAHSLAKHRVLEQYLLRYVDVLTSNLRIPEFRLTLVDGFAGGGLYRDWQTKERRFGSPLLMLRAMRDANVSAQTRRSRKDFHLDVEYFFVEKSPDAFAFLQAVIRDSEFRHLAPDRVKLFNDEFINCVHPIINHIRNRGRGSRAIFLLDQCGYAEVPFLAIREILSTLGNAEIILTFAADSLIDYLGAQNSMQPTLTRLGLDLTPEQLMSAKQHANWRLAIQILLHRELIKNSGAKFFTPFFVRSKDAHRDLWLIHLSNHARARDVMTELHWVENRSFAHYGGPGLMMLGYDQDCDERISGQSFLFDDIALTRTKESLVGQLPERISRHGDGITFSTFFAELTNETPATSDIIKAALADLLIEGEIEIRDETGLVQRQSGVQRRSDVLKRSAQKSLFVFGG